MTLHDAIQQVLMENKRPMTLKEISDEIIKNVLYTKYDGDFPDFQQIARRATIYDKLFDVTISLKRK